MIPYTSGSEAREPTRLPVRSTAPNPRRNGLGFIKSRPVPWWSGFGTVGRTRRLLAKRPGRVNWR